MGVLNDPDLEGLLSELHARSDAQLAEVEQYVRQARRSASVTKEADFQRFRSDKMLALSRDKAEFCYLQCRALHARTIVEIGTSYGVSTTWLAAAVRDSIRSYGGVGRVIGTECEPGKVSVARAFFQRAGLSDLIQIYEGDFRETLRQIDAPVDLMLIDAWAGAAKPALEIMLPWLRPGSAVLCDDVLASSHWEYFALLAEHGFRTTTLPFRDGLSLSVRCG